MDVSVVIPIHDEFENIPLLHQQLHDALDPLGLDYEILFIDDGSRDQSLSRLTKLADEDAAYQDHIFSPKLRADGGDASRH